MSTEFEHGYEDNVAERLLDTSRKVGKSPKYPFWTDYENKDDDVLAKVYSGAFMLRLTVYGPKVKSPVYGQGGMVRLKDGTVAFATAKHNHVSDNKATFSQAVAEFNGPNSFLTDLAAVQMDTLQAVYCSRSVGGEYLWEYGIDVSFAHFKAELRRTPPWTSGAYHVFDLVPEKFECHQGLRIGMSVYTEQEATVENCQAYKKNVAQDDLVNFFGYAGHFNIYTGHIIHSGENHIEHDINCFQGCAGAVMFLLEGDHSGKAFAVHSGTPAYQEASLAFKIHEGMQ